jgi:hypothetical protein
MQQKPHSSRALPCRISQILCSYPITASMVSSTSWTITNCTLANLVARCQRPDTISLTHVTVSITPRCALNVYTIAVSLTRSFIAVPIKLAYLVLFFVSLDKFTVRIVSIPLTITCPCDTTIVSFHNPHSTRVPNRMLSSVITIICYCHRRNCGVAGPSSPPSTCQRNLFRITLRCALIKSISSS